MTIDSHAVRTVVLAAWSAFLGWLWLSGEVARYLGPRTQWVVTFGAVALGALAVVYGRPLRTSSDGGLRPGRRELAGLAAMLVPIVAGCVVAHASLGSAAASKKLAGRGVDATQLAELASSGAKGVGFLELKAAEHNAGFAAKNGIHTGRSVHLMGFVQGNPAGVRTPFQLARFYIGCCVADAVPIDVTVERAEIPRTPLKRDQWVDVVGAVTRRGRGFVLQAEKLTRVGQPKHPYLYFSSGT